MLIEERTSAKVGIYVRVSTEEQATEGFSIRGQIEKLSDYAKIRDWEVYNIYSDDGISGKNITDRPEINKMIKDIVSGNIDTVLIFKVDRLTRNTKDLIELVDIFNQNSCDFISMMEAIDTKTASGRMFIKIIGIFAEFERENIIERTRLGIARKISEGYSICTSSPSYGYDRKKGEKVIQINQEEAKIVQWIFDTYLNETTSLNRIATELNIRGLRTKRGFHWGNKAVKHALTNPNYIGYVRHHIHDKEQYYEVKGKHEAIISDEIYKKVQIKIGKIEKKMYTKRPKDENFFSGTLFCSICGSKMRTQGRYEPRKDGTKRYIGNYRCASKEVKECIAKDVSHFKLDTAFIEYIGSLPDMEILDEDVTIEAIDKRDDLLELHEKYVVKLQGLEKKEKAIMKLYVSDEIDFDEYTKMIKLTKVDINNTKAEIEKLEIQLEEQGDTDILKSDVISNIKENWLLLTNSEKMSFVTTFIKSISVCNQQQEDTHYGKVKIESIEFFKE